MKSLKKILAATFSMLFLFSFAACGNSGVSSSSGNQGENSSSSAEEGGGTVKSGTIDIFLPIDADSETALKNVGNSYAKMMKGKGVNVRINVRSSQDPQGYITSVDGLLKYPDKQAGDIIQANTVAQYYGTGKLVLKLLRDMCKEEKKTVIIVTHNSALKDMADRVVYIKNGKAEKIELNPSPKAVEDIEW